MVPNASIIKHITQTVKLAILLVFSFFEIHWALLFSTDLIL